MHSRQRIALIQGIPPHALSQRVAQPSGLVQKELGIVRGRQAFQHGPQGRGQAVVDFVAGRPEGVAACRGEGVDLEHGVVGGHRLEGDVGVPPGRGEAAHVGELVGEAAALFLLLGGDDGDLVAELAAFLRKGVDV